MLTVAPLVPVQVAMAVFELVNNTGFPDAPPVAVTVNAGSPYVFEGRALKVMTWLPMVTSMLWLIEAEL